MLIKLNRFKNNISKFLRTLLSALVILSLLIILISSITCIKTGRFTLLGYKILYIASNSMEPELRKGQYVIVRTVKEDESITPGNIYTYAPDDRNYTVTHRLVDITNDGLLIFKGDNCTSNDPSPVDRNAVLYRVIFK